MRDSIEHSNKSTIQQLNNSTSQQPGQKNYQKKFDFIPYNLGHNIT